MLSSFRSFVSLQSVSDAAGTSATATTKNVRMLPPCRPSDRKEHADSRRNLLSAPLSTVTCGAYKHKPELIIACLSASGRRRDFRKNRLSGRTQEQTFKKNSRTDFQEEHGNKRTAAFRLACARLHSPRSFVSAERDRYQDFAFRSCLRKNMLALAGKAKT